MIGRFDHDGDLTFYLEDGDSGTEALERGVIGTLIDWRRPRRQGTARLQLLRDQGCHAEVTPITGPPLPGERSATINGSAYEELLSQGHIGYWVGGAKFTVLTGCSPFWNAGDVDRLLRYRDQKDNLPEYLG